MTESTNNAVDLSSLSVETLEKLKSLGIIRTTWKDYALLLLNSTPDPLRSIWREKVVTSVVHWEFKDGSISEGNLAGMEILTVLPSDFTQMVVDDYFVEDGWKKSNRLAGSKRMKVFIGHYPQESVSNEAYLCIQYILEHWQEWGHLIQETPLLKQIWDFSQKTGGDCVLPDEVLTYILEKPVDDSHYGVWMDVSEDVFAHGIPSERFAEYWKSEKLEGYPMQAPEKLEEQMKNFDNVCSKILKEDVAYSPCWKKICICILKNDTSMKYAGFGQTFREQQAREAALSAFSDKKAEEKRAKKEAAQLAKKIEKENSKS